MMRRFFADDSFWNTPLPANVAIDDDSARLVLLLQAIRPEGFWVNCEVFAIPVYEVDASTPRRTVHKRLRLDGNLPFQQVVEDSRPWITPDHPMGHGPGFGEDVPIPDFALADPEGDHHLAIVDWERMLAWDMWAAQRREDGEWESCTGMKYRLDGSGVFDLAQFAGVHDGESIHMYGPSRAPGVPAIAGLIMRDEIIAGEIAHKLSFASAGVALQQFVHPPACWTDGPVRRGFPEGATLQLDPTLDLDSLHLSRAGNIIARAWQQYGAVCVDGCGGNVIYAEGRYAYPDADWSGLLTTHDVEAISYEHLRVVRMEHIFPHGDTRHATADTDADKIIARYLKR